MRNAACLVVIKNPCAGKYEESLSPLVDYSEEIGRVISERAAVGRGRPHARVGGLKKEEVKGKDGLR